MNQYIALTIGPIHKTFRNVRKTREVWAASYMFSFLMKTIINELVIAGTNKDSFIIPSVTDDALKYKGAGLFPDRLLMQCSDKGDFTKVNAAVAKAINSFAKYFPDDTEKVKEFLKSYLRILHIEKELPPGVNFIEDLFLHLDTLELQNRPLSVADANCNYLPDFFRDINKNDFFKNNCYGKDDNIEEVLKLIDVNGQKRFESLVEISTRDLRKETKIKGKDDKIYSYRDLVNNFLWKDKDGGDIDNDQSFIESLKAGLPEKFKNYHKYIAIIKADGDKIGSAIKNMKGDIAKIKSFSSDLLKWAMDSDQIVRKYGGIPIYIGGDDMLLFAPVANGDATLVDLMNNIDESFNRRFINYLNDKNEHPTLSYGIAVNYYKYPLYEAMGKVDDLLKEAKNYSEKRNAICISVLKHSGSELKAIFTKSEGGSVKHLENILSHLDQYKLDNSFLSSVAFKLRDNEKVINCFCGDAKRTENFFDNNYDDYNRNSEKRNKKGQYLFAVEQALLNAIAEAEVFRRYYIKNNPEDNMEHKAISALALENVYSTLKISRFLKGMDDEK